jgi:N,N'-diacetyllegionaminate synthase
MIFIAEIGLNHNGNFGLCYELIKQAKYAGANIVKFQLGWKGKEGELNHFSEENLFQLKEWADYFEIDLMFSIFDKKFIKWVKKLNLKYIKVASRISKNDVKLTKELISQNKITFISLGMHSPNTFPNFKIGKKVSYLWCKSSYPTNTQDLKNFPKNFTKTRYKGYSDHCIGIENCILAISRGATIIEKHFTLDKSDNTIRDNALSATPKEFKTLVEIGSDIFKRLQYGI